MSPASSDCHNSSSMAIPVGLIPSEEKKEVDKRKLAFAVLISIVFLFLWGLASLRG